MINHSMPTVGLRECFTVSRVLRSQHLSQGKQVERFERELARFIGLKYGAVVSSGTAALYTALKALGIKQGHQVILPSFCCTAVLQAVNYTGADAVIVDISIDDYNLSFTQVQKKISRKTKAIVLLHMFGCPADIRPFMELPVPVIEDCAQ